MTAGEALASADNRPSGFDYMRLVLSLSVVAMHAVPTALGPAGNAEFWHSPVAAPFRLVLPMFFSLSGFLVAGSLLRVRSLGMFLGLRAIRIFPALIVEVVLSALILGPLFTTMTLPQYFGDPLFARYFLNTLGEPQYLLPGVFAGNPDPHTVNAQLWTIPFELACYVVLAGIAVFGLKKRKALILPATLGFLVVYLAWRLHGGLPLFPETNRPVAGPLLVVSFLLGVAAFLYRDRLVLKASAGWVSLAVGVLLLASPLGTLLALIAIAYATVWLGTRNPRRTIFIRGADYSYGIFLYGYPIQQMLAAASPLGREVPSNFIIAATIAWCFAALSWNFVEKPALGLRHYLASWEDRWLCRAARR